MVFLIYNLLIYVVAIFAFPYLIYIVVSQRKYRASILERLGFIPRDKLQNLGTTRPIWLHAVSVGEVMASLPVIKGLKGTFKDRPLIVSTVTETGNRVAVTKIKEADAIIYFPLDISFVVKKVIKMINPIIFITAETEIWPNFFRQLGKNAIPSLMINGRISPRSYSFYFNLRFFFKRVFKNFSLFSMQSVIDAERIIAIGAPEKRVVVSGNLKYDREVPILNEEEKAHIKEELGISNGRLIIVAGSTHKGEEEIIIRVLRVLKAQFPNLTIIIAPRKPERFKEVETLLCEEGISMAKRTDSKGMGIHGSPDVLLLDTIGELSRVYSIADVAFVGGSMVDSGGQNPLEPAAYKKPIIFGRYMFNFYDISDHLVKNGGAIQVHNQEQFEDITKKLLFDKDKRREMGEKAYALLRENKGATHKTLEIISEILNSTGEEMHSQKAT
ncbi:MAG: 3-deoxy-D-manno-octulosonic acid transferase [Thermodesulfobacteriota bacterium]|nr:3-deoxy-D-manno-octulosonic acid transferase [Thermodesulfobacteriota bacterium]